MTKGELQKVRRKPQRLADRPVKGSRLWRRSSQPIALDVSRRSPVDGGGPERRLPDRLKLLAHLA